MQPIYLAGFFIVLVWVIEDASTLKTANAIGIVRFICHTVACIVLGYAAYLGRTAL